MNRLTKLIKRLQLSKIISTGLLVTILLITTACNNGDKLGARPDNLPVQMGGQNNPHKAGGDGMTQYRVTDNPVVTERGKDNASLPSSTLLAAANRSKTSYPTDDSNVEGLLYGDKPAESLNSEDDFVSPTAQKQLLDPTQIPAKKQPIIDRSNPDNKLLEKVGQMFDDSGVLTDE